MNYKLDTTRLSVLAVTFLLVIGSFTFLPAFAVKGVSGTSAVNSSQPASPNASPPTLVGMPNAVVGGTATPFSVKVTNPSTNAYAITSITIVVPNSNWAFTLSPTCGGQLGTVGATSGSAVQCTAGTGSGLPPGFSATIALGDITGPTVTATSPAITAAFTSLVIDVGSSGASYNGNTFTEYSIATTTVSVALTSPTSTTFTAGGAAYTVTATLSSGQSGVPIVWSFGTSPYPSSTSFTASLTPSSGTTGSTGTITVTFTPSNFATDATTVVATIGTSTNSGASPTVTTVAGAPTEVAFAFTGSATTDYLEGGSPVVISSTQYAQASSGISLSLADQYANPIALSTSIKNITIQAVGGYFDVGGVLYSTLACGNQTAFPQIPTGADCRAGAGLSIPIPLTGTFGTATFVQSGTYGSVGELSAVITVGSSTYPGVSGQIVTSTFVTALSAPVISSTTPSPIAAGKSVNVTEQLTTAQAGVPITLNICLTCSGTSTGYQATFSANNLESITLFSNSAGFVSALVPVYTVAGATVVFNATAPSPTTATPTNSLSSGVSGAVTTTNGAISTLVVNVAAHGGATPGPDIKYATNGTTAYLDVAYADAYGNLIPLASAPSNQIQIGLAASSGLLSATQVYIAAGQVSTNGTGSFGAIQWTLPNAIGTTVTLTATGVVSGKTVTGSSSVAIVSALPSISVTSPKPLNGISYASTALVSFSGQANVSLGLPTNTIARVGYKIGSGGWSSVSTASQAQVTWNVLIALQSGLNTVTFNTTDSSGNVVVAAPLTVLVDTKAPQFSSLVVCSCGSEVNVNITSAGGDLNASSVQAWYNGTAVAASSLSVTGTNNPGTSVTYSVNIGGLTSGVWSLKVQATTLAGLTNSTTQTVTISVPNTGQYTLATPVGGHFNGYQVVNASVSSHLTVSQTVVVLAVLKNSAGQSVGVFTGTAQVGAGGTLTVPVVVNVPSGTYTANVFVWSLTGAPISVSYTATVTY